MEPHSWIVNVARGRHIVTDDLVEALRSGVIGGAGLDVTDPGEGQLHPPDFLAVVECRPKRIDGLGIGPDDAFRLIGFDQLATTGDHCVREPVGAARRAEVDAGRGTVRHLSTDGSGRSGAATDPA